MKRFRNTLIALVVLLIIGGYAFVNYYFSKPEAVKTAFNIKADDIAKIDLKYPDRDLVLEHKPGDQWIITKPIGAFADQTTAGNLARAIADCQITKTVEDKADNLAPFGLDKPQVTVIVTDTKGKTLPGARGREGYAGRIFRLPEVRRPAANHADLVGVSLGDEQDHRPDARSRVDVVQGRRCAEAADHA